MWAPFSTEAVMVAIVPKAFDRRARRQAIFQMKDFRDVPIIIGKSANSRAN